MLDTGSLLITNCSVLSVLAAFLCKYSILLPADCLPPSFYDQPQFQLHDTSSNCLEALCLFWFIFREKWGENDFSEMGSACSLWLDWQTIFKYFNPNCEVILHVVLIVGGLLYLHWPTKPLWYFFIFSKFYALGKVKVKTCRPFFMEQDQKSTWCDNI